MKKLAFALLFLSSVSFSGVRGISRPTPGSIGAATNAHVDSVENALYYKVASDSANQKIALIDSMSHIDSLRITAELGFTPFNAASTLGVNCGGTGLASYTSGDILYATGSTTLAKLAKGTANQILGMNAGATGPEYKTVTAGTRIRVVHAANSITISTSLLDSANTWASTQSFAAINISGTVNLSSLTASTSLELNGSKNVISVTKTGTGSTVHAGSPTIGGIWSLNATTGFYLNDQTSYVEFGGGAFDGLHSHLRVFGNISGVPNDIRLDFGAGGSFKLQDSANGTFFSVSQTTRNAVFGGNITTAAPSGGTAGAWKFGVKVVTASVLDATQYVQVDVDGVPLKFALIQ